MGSVWLLVCYEGKNFDVRVTDTDKMQLLDLIDDFRVESAKQNVLIPDTYDIYYKIKNNGRKMDVKDDMSLVHMFASFEGVNTINIWLKNTKNPIKEFALFEDLRRKNEEKKKENDENARLEREAIFVEPLMTEVPVVDIVSNKTSYVRIVNTQVSSNIPTTETETPQPHHEAETPLQSNKDIQNTQQFPTSDRFCPDSTPFFTQNSQNKPQQKQLKMAKKIPQTTAKRKGISALKGIKIDDNGDKVGNEIGNDKKNNARVKKNSKTSFVYVDEDSEDSDDIDYDYDVESDTESESVLEEGDEGSEGETSEQVKDTKVSSHPFDATTTVIDENDEINETYLDKIYRNGKMFVPQRWGDIKLRQWMMFTSKSQFLDVLSDYCIQQGFEVIVEKSDKTRVRAECCMTKCTWRVHCGRLPDGLTWAIKILSGDHDKDCFFLKKNSMATVSWMANKMKSDLRAQPEMPVKAMVQWFMDKFAINVCQRTMYKVRIAAAERIHGGHEQSYNSLAAFAEMIKSSNPGSHDLLTWCTPNNPNIHHFKSMFISFGESINGFLRGCRPFIDIDGCHLTWRYKGVLLSALTLDGNNSLFLIAYAVVSRESIESWAYFFRNISISFKQQGCIKWDWTFISDRMKGVETALEKEFPRCKRRICAQHLYENFKEKWNGPAYYDLFWEAAKATSVAKYNKVMERMSKLSKESVVYLSSIPQQWSKHQFDYNVACDHNTSNFVESFNALAKPFRGKPILELMDAIRVYSMDKIAERLELAENLNDDEPTPYAKRKVEKNCSLAKHCTIVSAGGGEYEVYDGACAFPVNILRGTCSCGKWQISGIPCKHACRAIYENKEEPTSYVHGFLTGLCYKLTYGAHMHPIPDKDQWPTFDFPMVFPPIQAKGVGRPAKNRKRKTDEPRKGKRSTTVTCSICKNVGHNARACQGGPTAKAKNVAVAGRKRKQSDVAGSSTSKNKKQKDVADQKKKQSHEAAPSGGSGSKVA